MNVGISRLRGNVFFPLIWNFYHSSHPNISIELVDGNSNKLDELLQTGKIDLYIGIDVPLTANLERIELAREKIHCCFSQPLLKQYYPDEWQNLLSEFQDGVNLARIINLPFITLRPGNRLRKSIDLFFSHYMKPQFIFECDQQELVYQLSKSGAGAGLLSPVVFYQHKHEKDGPHPPFYIFPVINEISENTVYLVYRKDYPLTQYALDFIQDACMVFRSYSRSINRRFM